MKTVTESIPNHAYLEIIDKYSQFPSSASKTGTYLPDPCFKISFLLSDDDCKVMLTGPRTQKTLFPVCNYEQFIIRFKVGNLPRVLDVKPSDLVNNMIQLSHVSGIGTDNFCEMLLKKKSVGAKQDLIEQFMFKMKPESSIKNDIYRQSASIIESRGGRIEVSEISNILCVSVRTLERAFKEILGFPPKQFIRLYRFQKIFEKLQKNDRNQSHADMAYEFGYTDQSHFINDFKSLSGKSPNVFMKKDRCRVFTIQPI